MIGQTIYIRDENHRVYDENHRTIERERYRPYVVIGETPRSWVVDDYGRRGLIDKATMRVGGSLRGAGLSHVALTIGQVEAAIWLHENRQRVVRMVQDCQNVNLLRQIDALLHSA